MASKRKQMRSYQKDAVFGLEKASNRSSKITVLIGNEFINEILYPREDHNFIRDIDISLSSFSGSTLIQTSPELTIEIIKKNEHSHVTNEIVLDPERNALLQYVTIHENSHSSMLNFSFSLIHKGFFFIEDYKGFTMLIGQSGESFIAAICSSPFHRVKIFSSKRQITGQIQQQGHFLFVMGFGVSKDEASHNAMTSLLKGFEEAKRQFAGDWNQWMQQFSILKDINRKMFKKSISVLRMTESASFPGAILASPTVPWKSFHNVNHKGYRFVWPRDLVECASAFLFLGAKDNTLRILNYLFSLQEKDGYWMQNYTLEGKPSEKGMQMDQVALPILLEGYCMDAGILEKEHLERYWDSSKKALEYLIQYGPCTHEGRWEENQRGYSPYTMATEITALLYGCRLAKHHNNFKLAEKCQEIAEKWNRELEMLCYVTGTELAKEVGVEGYYVRSNSAYRPIQENKDTIYKTDQYLGKDHDPKLGEIVSVDALALIRYGLRSPHDPKILNTIKVIDAKLKQETPFGPSWHRFNYDHYGEHPDGSPFDGRGIGRLWPLLTGERAMYEIAAGNFDYAEKLLKAMENFANQGFFPEQVWNTHDIPERGLFFGRFTGSAMPLSWTHAEYIKVCLSLHYQKVIDLPLNR